MRDRRMQTRRVGASSWLTGLAAAVLMTLVVQAAGAVEVRAAEPGKAMLVGVVNVNTASAEELQLLPGVGPARAKAILEHRRAHGDFGSAEDLLAISGIGERALARIRDHLAFEGKTTATLQR